MLENVSTPEDALEQIQKVVLRIELELARYNLGLASEWVNRLEQLCSFLYLYHEKAEKKLRDGIPLTKMEMDILPKMDISRVLKDYIPQLKSRINKLYPDENIYGIRIPYVKNIKQKDCLNMFWRIIKALNLGMPEYVSVQPHETIFTRVKI